MGNSIAFMVLGSWPVVAAFIFARFTVERALILTVLAGYLALPPVTSINLPLLPDLEKNSMIALTATFGALLCKRHAENAAPRLEPWLGALIVLWLVTPLVTAMTNTEPLVDGAVFRPGMSLSEGIANMLSAAIEIAPFLLGFWLLSSEKAIREWLFALVGAALIYSIPMMMEVRLSPQLNVWIYGFFAHDFSQTIRYGGFRPMVFLTHGLWVAMFTAMALMASAALLRIAGPEDRARRQLIVIYLFAVLILCKSLASILYALALVPLILLARPHRQITVATVLAVAVLLYPLAQWLRIFPVEPLIDFLTGLDAERAHSLNFRFMNEFTLLDRATEKMLAGWGGWGRNQVVDPVSGLFVTVTDGYWIVVMTTFGLLGYVGSYGLLCGAVIRAGLAARKGVVSHASAGLAILLSASLVDLIPNATLVSLTWLSAGALTGYAVRGAQSTQSTAQPVAARKPAFRAIIG